MMTMIAETHSMLLKLILATFDPFRDFVGWMVPFTIIYAVLDSGGTKSL